MVILKNSIEHWPETPEEENTTWYKLYRKYESMVQVHDAHRLFLLSRDIAVVALLFAIIGAIGLLVVHSRILPALLYFVLLGAHYLILMVVARNHGNRFVCNVLAEHSAGDSQLASRSGS